MYSSNFNCRLACQPCSKLDPRDSICDTTPLSEIEAQLALEEADITDSDEENDPTQPKPMPMTEEEK